MIILHNHSRYLINFFTTYNLIIILSASNHHHLTKQIKYQFCTHYPALFITGHICDEEYEGYCSLAYRLNN